MAYPVSPFGAKMLFQFPGIGLGFSPCLNLPMKQYASLYFACLGPNLDVKTTLFILAFVISLLLYYLFIYFSFACSYRFYSAFIRRFLLRFDVIV